MRDGCKRTKRYERRRGVNAWNYRKRVGKIARSFGPEREKNGDWVKCV